jgi:PKHD-type hydroxylase
MMMIIGDILNVTALASIAQTLPKLRYEDGRATAGFDAAGVKQNEQARGSVTLDLLRDQISAALLGNDVFAAAVRPKALTRLLISKTEVGGFYGRHIDSPIIGGLRTDVAFTVFLTPPEAYDGGELVVETVGGDESFKLPAGSAVVYSAATLHRVGEVTRGTRYVAVGWVQSLIRDPAKRELLFDLEQAKRSLFARERKTEAYDLVAKSAANLMRMWAEI